MRGSSPATERRRADRRGKRGRRATDLEIDVFGVRAVVPRGWEDHSIHRYAAPSAASALPMQARVKAKAAPQFRDNVVVTKLPVPPGLELAQAFVVPNQNSSARNPTFGVQGGGTGEWLDQPVAWQDTSFVDPGVKLQMFQRSIAVMPSKGTLVMFTLTCDRNELDGVSRDALRFDPTSSSSSPPRVRTSRR